MINMKNMISKFYKLLLGFLLLVFLILIYNSICIGSTSDGQKLNPLLILLLSITYLLLLYKVNKVILSKQKNEGNLIAVLLSIIGFSALFIFSYNFCVLPNRDLNTIIMDAKSLIDSNYIINDEYYSIYSNQVGLLLTVKYIFKLADIFHIDRCIFACLISSLCISISLFFTYLSIKKVSTKSVALTLLIFLIFNPLFYLLVSFYYSDIFIMPIISILIYILLNIKDDKLCIKKVLLLILVGLLIYIGYKIRPVAFFILIAYYVMMIFKCKIKILLKYTIFFIIGILIGYSSCHLIEKDNNIKCDENVKFPATHWIMMGLNKDFHGRWNINDYEFTHRKINYNTKVKSNGNEIVHRLKENGIFGNLSLQSEKLKINWAYGDGAYSTYYYSVTKYNNLYEYINGHNRLYLSYFLQVSRVVLFMMIGITLLLEVIKENREYNFIIIFTFGSILFYALWEVFYRYSFCFIPSFVLLGSLNLSKLSNTNHKVDNINILKYRKVLYALIIFFTMYCFVESYNKYCLKKSNYLTTSANSILEVNGKSIGGSEFILNKDTEYKQTFKTNKTFNYIKIKYSAEKKVEGKIYLKLYDENNKLVEEFAKNFINQKNMEYLVFGLKKPINTHNKTYTFTLSTDIENSDIKLMVMNSMYYDYFPTGNLYLNNKKLSSDLQVNMGSEVSAPLLSKKTYLLCAAFILCIQLITFGFIRTKKRTS